MTTSEPVTAVTPQSLNAWTEYVILKADDSGLWDKAGTAKARSSEAAIQKFSEAKGNLAGTYIAIPTKRWKPLKVTAKTTTTLHLEEAKS